MDKKNDNVRDYVNGVLGKSIQKLFSFSELEINDIKITGDNILEYDTGRKFDIIICNPPGFR